ncbi:hypothetical protein [Haloglomus salinum]|uniref:hypothetical protein n=1 Tax=Haloglomus salinum TaxID=2962673 RepID=UPI0020C9AF05|nr:hypothetical protein [Haloglomus salinum]
MSDDSSDGPDVWVDDTDESPPDGPGSGGPEPGDTLAVGDALSGAAARLVRPIGLALVAGYLLVGFAGAVATTSLFATLVPRVRAVIIENSAATPADFPPLADPSPLALPVEVSTALGLVLVTALLAETLNVVAIQVFVRDAREFPREALADLPARSLVSFVANSLAAVAVFVGFVAFILPGVFLAVAFYLVRAAVAVEGAGVVPALRRSWRLVKGHRIRVLFVLLVVVLVGQVATLPTSLVEVTPLGETAAAAFGVVLGAVVTTFGAAVAARVYVQLAGIDAASVAARRAAGGPDSDGADGEPDDSPEDEPIGALTPEEIDEQFGKGN